MIMENGKSFHVLFFKQKTAYEMRISDWSSDVCSSDLDEADVYIRCRDNDLEHNAIVAEFLRTLEYFNGLLFMTTNRINDVDDAILSRCKIGRASCRERVCQYV